MTTIRPSIKEARRKFFGGPCPGYGCGIILNKESILIYHWKTGHMDREVEDNPPALGVSTGDTTKVGDRAGG